MKKLILLLVISCAALALQYMLEKQDIQTTKYKSKQTINVQETLNDDELSGMDDGQGTDWQISTARKD